MDADAKQSGTEPLVTVGIAIYNHEPYVAKCLDSVIRQTYRNIEIIAIDDGSSDRSYEVARQTLQAETTRRVVLKRRKNRGPCQTLNEIIDLSRGKYISFVGSDDFWAENKVHDHVRFLESHPEFALVHSNSYEVDEAGTVRGHYDATRKLHQGRLYAPIVLGTGGINTSSHLYRTSVYDVIGRYDPQFRFEDTDFWLRLTKEFDVGFLPGYHAYHRRTGNNLSRRGNMLRFFYDELLKIYRKNVTEPELRRAGIARIYKKFYSRGFRELRPMICTTYLCRYWLCRLSSIGW